MEKFCFGAKSLKVYQQFFHRGMGVEERERKGFMNLNDNIQKFSLKTICYRRKCVGGEGGRWNGRVRS